jgi:beta-lactamase class A
MSVAEPMPETGHRPARPRWIPVAILTVLGVSGFLVVFGFRSLHHSAGSATSHTYRPPARPAWSDGSTTLPTSTATSTTTPTSTFPAALTGYVAARTGTVTAAVENLATGQTLLLNPGVVQDEASVVKVDVMATLLAQQPSGSVPSSPSQQELLTTMIEDSDNDSATALWDQVGGPTAISTFNQRVGMESTTPSPCVTCTSFPWPGWGLTTTTPVDQLALLRQFVLPNPLLSQAQRTYGLGLMESVIPTESWGVSGGVPSGVTVALKNGWLPLTGETDWQVNSVGWIDGDGRDYIAAIFTTGNPNEQYGIDTINYLSQSLWSQLG